MWSKWREQIDFDSSYCPFPFICPIMYAINPAFLIFTPLSSCLSPHMSCLHTATSFFSVCHVFLCTSSVISLHPLSFFFFNIIIPFIGFCPSHFLLCCERLACWKQVTAGKVIRQDGCVWKWMWLSVPMTLGPSSQNTSMTHLLSLSILNSAENTTARRARRARRAREPR